MMYNKCSMGILTHKPPKFKINRPQDESNNTHHFNFQTFSRSRSNITGKYDSLKTVPQQLIRLEVNTACSSFHKTALNDHFIVHLAIRPM